MLRVCPLCLPSCARRLWRIDTYTHGWTIFNLPIRASACRSPLLQMDSSSTPSTHETPESNSSTSTFSDDELQHTPPPAGSSFVPTKPQDTDIIGSLWRLHADELAWLAQHEPPVVKPGEAFFPKVRIPGDGKYIVSTKSMS